MRCEDCKRTLMCWGGFKLEELHRCYSCRATMEQVGGHWYFWHCLGAPHVNGGAMICVECSPLDWVEGNSLNHIHHLGLSASPQAHKSWRNKLYRKIKEQKLQREQKRVEEITECAQVLEGRRNKTEPVDKTRGSKKLSRWRGKKQSDVGKVYK